MEDLAKVVTEATYASEFRYRNPLVEEGTVSCAISQSGETADTLAALREAKEKGRWRWAIVNVVGVDHRPRDRWGDLSSRRPGDRRRQHEGVYMSVRVSDAAVAIRRPAAVHGRRASRGK